MKKRIYFFALALIFLISGMSYAEDSEGESLVYVIPVHEEITKATSKYMSVEIENAKNVGADFVLIDLDTYGGLVQSAEEIKNMLLSLQIPTGVFINSKAESAGVLISISCKNIFMRDDATIGSAETIPNNEKNLSMWKSLLRSTAQVNGRNPEIVEAMADVDVEVDGISEKGKLLNLTAKEALECGISDGTRSNIDDVLAELGFSDAKIVYAKEDWATKFAKTLSGQWASSLLLTIGFIGLVVEFLVPGFGLPGIIGIVSFVLFYGSNLLVGNADIFSLIFFVVGILLIIVEIFIPGFGLPGISGIVLLVLGISTSMKSIEEAMIALLFALLFSVIAIVIIFKYGFKGRTFEKITLNSSIDESAAKTLENISVGDRGRTLTPMRSYGYIEVNGNKFDATAESNYIDANKDIEVIKILGNKIIVKEI